MTLAEPASAPEAASAPDQPLAGWRVLLTRAEGDSGQASQHLARHGARCTAAAMIVIEAPLTVEHLDQAITALHAGAYAWVGFTSVHAVYAVRARCEHLGVPVAHHAQVAAVGEATAAALREWGMPPDLVPAANRSAAGLLAQWPTCTSTRGEGAGRDSTRCAGDAVLLPRSDLASDVLPAGLRAKGWAVDEVIAYRTVPAPPPPADLRAAVATGGFDAILFTSGSTVRALLAHSGAPHPRTVIGCIGAATATTAKELGLRVDVLAPEATIVALVDALADYAATVAQ